MEDEKRELERQRQLKQLERIAPGGRVQLGGYSAIGGLGLASASLMQPIWAAAQHVTLQMVYFIIGMLTAVAGFIFQLRTDRRAVQATAADSLKRWTELAERVAVLESKLTQRKRK